MAHPDSAPTFAVVQMDDGMFDTRELARLFADILEVEIVDLAQLLPQRSGILAENLTEPIAQRCLSFARSSGIVAQIVPQSAVQEVPTLVTLRSCQILDTGLACSAAGQTGHIKWPDILWVDFVSVPEQRKEKRVEEQSIWNRKMTGDGIPIPDIRLARQAMPDRAVSLDLVTYQPWLLLRIPMELFEFAASGLPVLPGRRQNLVALATELAARATAARLGPGMEFLESGGPPREHRLPSEICHRGYLRWRLTRIFLE